MTCPVSETTPLAHQPLESSLKADTPIRTPAQAQTPPVPTRRKHEWWLYFYILFFFLAAVNSFKPYDFSVLLTPDSPKSVLLLTAHPDDEAMFFSPTVLGLVKQGWDVRGLCLSTEITTLRGASVSSGMVQGNESGLGATRSKELVDSYKTLGVPQTNVQILEDSRFQDGMQNHWNVTEIALVLNDYLQSHPVSLAITFDRSGITGHPNHTPLPLSLLTLSSLSSTTPTPRILTLSSPATLTKFTGPLYPFIKAYLSHFQRILWNSPAKSSFKGATIDVIASPTQWVMGWRAMLKHQSQLVWFRWLYLLFSRLMWLNELVVVS